MSGLEQEFQEELPVEDVEDSAEEEVQSEEDAPQSNPDIDRAMKDGWRPKDEWNGDPDDWVSAKKFNERGEMMGTIKSTNARMREMEREFNDRLESNNKLHEIQKKALISDYESKRNEAIDVADTEKALEIQGKIDELKSSPEVEVKPKDNAQSVIDEFNSNNPWIYEQTPKAAYAQAQFSRYSQEMTVDEAVAKMQADITRHFPETNPNRDAAPMTEKRQSRPGKRSEPKLGWGDLTNDELKFFSAGDWNKEEYLKVVADSRKAGM